MNIANLCENLYEDLDAKVDSIVLGDDYKFILECDDWESQGSIVRRRFEITCVGVIEASLTVGCIGSIDFRREHPLLFKYNLPYTELYFSSVPKNAYEILGHLVEAHEKIYLGWRPLSECINDQIIETLQGGHGLLAHGPSNVMDAYTSAISHLLKLKAIHHDFNKAQHNVLLFSEGEGIICDEVSVNEF